MPVSGGVSVDLDGAQLAVREKASQGGHSSPELTILQQTSPEDRK